MPEIDPLEREIGLWMKDFAAVGHGRTLPDANSIWVKAKLLQTAAAMERAVRPITRMQIAAYLIVAGGWAALMTWKWSALAAWVNSFTPAHIIMGAAGADTMRSLSLTFVMALVILTSVTVVLAFHTILAEE
jgi:hypothetical protein